MSLPVGNIKSIQTPDTVNHEIIPRRLKGSDFRYAFELNQTLKCRKVRIYFDTNYETQLGTYLAGLTYDSSNPLGVPICNLMTITNSNYPSSPSYYLVAVDLTSASMGYCLATFDDYSAGSQYHLTVRYATANGSGYGMTWTQGYNNLDASNGFDFVSEDAADCTVAFLNNTSTTWNGAYIYPDAGRLVSAGTELEVKLPPIKQESVLALQSDLEDFVKEDDLADVALSGSYNDLTNKPTIVSDVKVNNTTVVSSGVANIITNTAYNASTNKIATMADIPSVPITSVKTLDTTATTAQSTSASETISGSGSITLHKVAKTGTYSDLIGKPTIPTVNNNTITLTQGGVTKGSFTLNQNSDATISLDGGGAADYNDLTNKPITNIVSGTTYSEGNYYRKSVDTYLEPFMVGRTLSQGDKIYFDTTKGDEVSSLLATLPYSGGAYNLLSIGDGKGIGAVSLSGYKLLAMIDDSGGQYIGGTIIFSNRAGTVTSGLTVTAGWQNLASDGSYTWAKSGTSTILSLSADDWNGIIVGTSWNDTKALTKYEIGDLPVDLSTDGIYVDVSKEKELRAFLEGLSYEEGEPAGFALCQLLQIGGDGGVYAIRDATGDTTKYLTCLLIESFSVFYATDSGTVMPDTPYETTYGKGFQNLNSDNCHLYASGQSGTGTFSIRAIVNSEWNGKFFGSNISNKEGAIYRYEGGELKRVLVEGDAAASGGGSVEIPVTDVQVNGTSILSSGVANLVTETAYDASSNKIATKSDLHSHSNKSVLDNIATQTAYTSKGTSTKVATITTNTSGQVTSISETSIAFPVTSVNGSTGAITGLATTSQLPDMTNVAYKNVNNNFTTGQTISGNCRASAFTSDNSGCVMSIGNGNEISFGMSSGNAIYFGYDNRTSSTAFPNTYNFGAGTGSAGATSGTINCGNLNGSNIVAYGTVKVGNTALLTYNSTTQSLDFTF